jgi:hypothetical protein
MFARLLLALAVMAAAAVSFVNTIVGTIASSVARVVVCSVLMYSEREVAITSVRHE